MYTLEKLSMIQIKETVVYRFSLISYISDFHWLQWKYILLPEMCVHAWNKSIKLDAIII